MLLGNLRRRCLMQRAVAHAFQHVLQARAGLAVRARRLLHVAEHVAKVDLMMFGGHGRRRRLALSRISKNAAQVDCMHRRAGLFCRRLRRSLRCFMRLRTRWRAEVGCGVSDRFRLYRRWCRRRIRRQFAFSGLRIAGPREIDAEKRGLAAQPLGDDTVDVRFAQQCERAPKALDVGTLPWLPRHEIFGDDARFSTRAKGQVGIGQLRLRAVHRGLEPAVHADFHQPHQRGNVVGHAIHKFVERGSGRSPLFSGDGGARGHFHAFVAGVGIHLRHRASQNHERVAPVRIFGEQPLQQRGPLGDLSVAQLHLGQHPQELGIGAGDLGRERGSRATQIAARDIRSRQPRAHRDICRLRLGDRGQRGKRLVLAALPEQLFSNLFQLVGGGGILMSRVKITPRHVGGHQDLPQLGIIGRHRGGLSQQLEPLLVPTSVLQFGRDLFELFDGRRDLVELDPPPRANQARVEIGSGEVAEHYAHFREAAAVAAPPPPLEQREKLRSRLHQQALPREHAAQQPHSPLIVGLDLQNLFVERDGLGKKALRGEMVRDAAVLGHGFLNLARPKVQIAKRVGGVQVRGLVFDDAAVFGNGQIELALAQKLLRFSQRPFAIKWHRSSVGG